MFNYLRLYFFNPDRKQLAAGNIVFMVICLTLGALVGSATTVYVVCGIVYGTYHILRGTVKLRVDRPVQAVALAFSAYFLAELIAGVANPGAGTVSELMSVALFLGFVPLISLMVISPALLLEKVEISAAVIAVASALMSVGLILVGFDRIELSAGNAGVLAVVASVLLVINLNAAFRRGQKYWQFGFAGSLAAILVILLTGMRALWPVIFILPVFFVLMQQREDALLVSRKALAGIVIGLMVVSVSAYPVVSWRVVQLSRSLKQIDEGNYTSSIGDRLVLWKAGYELALQQPVFGYGPGNVSKIMAESTAEARGGALSFSHFHSAFLNEMVRAGIVGVAALLAVFIVPILVVIKAPRSVEAPHALKIMIGTQIVYMISGLTGIMLGHDITDSLYLCVIVFCIYLVYPSYHSRQVL